MKQSFSLLFLLVPYYMWASTITGSVKDTKGNALPYSSILVKGTAKATTANAKGLFSINLPNGKYTLVCQHVGYQSVAQTVTLTADVELAFVLAEQQYQLSEVVVKTGAEDPAYAIIRKAIKKRSDYDNENQKFECQVYIKGQLQLRNYPKNFMGEKVDFEDGDTSKRKMIFLSETLAKYAKNGKDRKIEVLSTKVSGNSSGFGFASPSIISLYSNIVPIGRGLNPRGFISPIADNALNFYKYHFEGTFYENGKEISRIKVIPKRKYEPLFSGYITIIENEWRLQSVQLSILKEQQMQLLDTLVLEQLYVPMKDTWVIKQQLIQPAGKIFGFDFFGSFLQVYENFELEPQFKKKFFDNTILKILDSANKKPMAYWDSIRPVPLLEAEVRDYKKKDSLEQVRKDPKYVDSLDRVRNKITSNKLLFTGMNFSKERKKENLTLSPLINLAGVLYNPVEGRYFEYNIKYNKQFEGRKNLAIEPVLRYGFSNKHANAYVNTDYNFGKKYLNNISFSAGQKVFQMDNANPIDPINNTLAAYYWQHNHIKIYEAAFAKISYSKGLGDGFTVGLSAQFQDRKPLENTIDSLKGKAFTPNYPTNIVSSNITAHQAFTASVNITWRPGAKYIELPDRKIALGSKYPTFNLNITKGLATIFGSDVDYTKWKFSISDNLDFKLGGRFSYRLATGGFINANKLSVIDYNHFLGNETVLANTYLSSFQLMPYYQYSNTAKTYGEAHVEYHLNGLITNKIPLLRKWNWFFVMGGNGLYINQNSHYYEAFFGIENIFKVIRVDAIKSFDAAGTTATGIRVALPLFGRRGN
ncbi:DUF5686 and carboxypeptidase regulatory-like domain-containing protein [Parasediminibacterium paludis]|uniref:DUF5686 and carboxypeptidase regulatory-like domain-containing protein n=1 Tax=Parasediminibacterium paludis TaxID=908966 RepID=A0ABV8PR20_9BACT